VETPYCADYIHLAPKGTTYYDFQHDRRDVYPLDGVTTGCFEKASGTYVLEGAAFRLIVDGD
jgi:hypothetical protein